MVVMISGHGNIETAVRATKLGAFDFIEKPLSMEKTCARSEKALDFLRLEEENRRLREELGQRYQVIGESVPMKALRQQIALAAPTNGRVLIYGESGTGKELVARALHAAKRPLQRTLRRSKLRRDSRRTDRVRIIRPHQGQLHRRQRRQSSANSKEPTTAHYSSTKSAT